MSSLDISRPPPTHQADAVLSQVTPVQNTWYTVLATKINARLLQIACKVATTGETLELSIVIDGKTITASLAATAGTLYYYDLAISDTGLSASPVTAQPAKPFIIEGRNVQVQIRKTTAAGTGTITACASWQKW